MSSTIAPISASLSTRPWILARTASRLSGGVAGVTRDRAAGRLGEAAEGRLGQAQLVGRDQAVIGDQQRGQQRFGIAAQLDAARSRGIRPAAAPSSAARSPPRFRGRYRD